MPPFAPHRPGPFSLAAAGPVTRALATVLVAASLLGAVLDRRYGLGTSQLWFARDAIVHGELWRLLTYPFVKAGNPIGLMLAAASIWLFGAPFEQRFGSARFARFCAATTAGAALLALPLGWLFDAIGLFSERDVACGPEPLIDALLVLLTLEAPRSPVMFGFVLPMQARTLLQLVLGFELVGGLMTGISSLGLTLGGMAMGWAWARSSAGTGPLRALRLRLRTWRLRRRGLFVVPPPRGGFVRRPDRRDRLN